MKRSVTLILLALMLVATAAQASDMGVGQETGTIIGRDAIALVEGLWDGAQTVGTITPGTSVIVLQRFGDMMQVFARGQRLVGWIKMDYVQLDTIAPVVHTGVVISQNVSIRATPNTTSTLLVTATNGAVVEILDESNGWYHVHYWDGKQNTPVEGYARTYFIVRDPAFITTTQLTYVYATPSGDSKMVGQLVAGTQLVVIGEWDSYWVVNLRSASGFIRKSDVAHNQIIDGNG